MRRLTAVIGLGAALLAGPATAQTALEPSRSMVGAYLASEHALGTGDLEGASQLIDRALAFQGRHPRLVHQAFMLALNTGRIDRAVELAPRVDMVQPGSQIVSMVMAVDLMIREEPRSALAVLEAMDDTGLGRYTVPLLRAWVAEAVGDVEARDAALDDMGAVPEFERIVAYHRALIADMNGDHETAVEAMDYVVQGAFTSAIGLHAGAVLEHAGEAERAAGIYRDFLELIPDLPNYRRALERVESGELNRSPVIADPMDGLAEAFTQLADLFQGQGADEIALIYVRLADALAPGNARLVPVMGRVLMGLDHWEEAANALQVLPMETPDGWSSHYTAVTVLARLDRLEEAEILVRRLVDLRPDISGAMLLLGDVLRYRQNFEDAVGVYQEAVRMAEVAGDVPWTFHYKLAMVLERTDRWDAAEAAFRAALALEPDDADLLNYLGYSLIDRGLKLEEGEEMIRRAVELQPDSGYIVDSLGWAHYRLGRYDEAVVELERAISLLPGDPTIMDHLGDAYWMVGREREARYRWRDAARLAGDDTEKVLAIEAKLVNGVVDPNPIVGETDQAGAEQ